MGTVISSNYIRSPNIVQIILDREGTISNVTLRCKARMPAYDRQQRLLEMRITVESRKIRERLGRKAVVQDQRILGRLRNSLLGMSQGPDEQPGPEVNLSISNMSKSVS